MSDVEVESSADLPDDLAPSAVARFFPEHGAERPIWLEDGHPDLEDLQLDGALVERLRLWAAYWNRTYHWDDGWPVGTPDAWWDSEEDALPRDLAVALGRNFVIHANGRYLRSRLPAGTPQAAAAVTDLHCAAEAEAVRIRAQIAEGATFTIWSGAARYQPEPLDLQPDPAHTGGPDGPHPSRELP